MVDLFYLHFHVAKFQNFFDKLKLLSREFMDIQYAQKIKIHGSQICDTNFKIKVEMLS